MSHRRIDASPQPCPGLCLTASTRAPPLCCLTASLRPCPLGRYSASYPYHCFTSSSWPRSHRPFSGCVHVARTLRIWGNQRPLLLVTWSCAVVVASEVPLACWCAASRPVRSLSLRRSVVPLPWCLPLQGAFAPGFTGRLHGAHGGQPRTGLMVPAAGSCRDRGAGLAPRRTRSVPRDGVIPGGTLQRRSLAACAAGFLRVLTREPAPPVDRWGTQPAHQGCLVWTPTHPSSGRGTRPPGPLRVFMCSLFLAGSDRPASRARSGAPQLSCGRSCCLLSLLAPPGEFPPAVV